MAIADKLLKLSAICHKCGEDAVMTQRLIDGEPAPFRGPTVQIGGVDTYEARCRRCFQEGPIEKTDIQPIPFRLLYLRTETFLCYNDREP